MAFIRNEFERLRLTFALFLVPTKKLNRIADWLVSFTCRRHSCVSNSVNPEQIILEDGLISMHFKEQLQNLSSEEIEYTCGNTRIFKYW